MNAVPPLDCLAYRVPQAAKLLNISPRQVWLMIQQGRIKARKLGKCTLILRGELDAVLAGTETADRTYSPAYGRKRHSGAR